MHTRNYLNRLDNARRETEDKQKRLHWNTRSQYKSGSTQFRSSSMEDINPEAYLKNDNQNQNDLLNMKKNLRDELHSMTMLPESEEEEF